jgi:hypothetical protein
VENNRIAYFGKWFSPAADSCDIVGAGSSGVHVANITAALLELGYRPKVSNHFGDEASKAVREFQAECKHRNIDGMFGPGTRRLLTKMVLKKTGPEFFEKLKPSFSSFYQVFISYASIDEERVNKVGQWLRNNDIVVRRDICDFQAGQQLPRQIEKYLQLADKAIIVYSRNSQSRGCPAFERFMAESVEKTRGTSYLVYLLLDGVSPPKHDPRCIYVSAAANKSVKEAGEELLHAIARVERKKVYPINPG